MFTVCISIYIISATSSDPWNTTHKQKIGRICESSQTGGEAVIRINKHSPDTTDGTHVGKSDRDVDNSDQGTVFGCARGETEKAMPKMATRLGKRLSDACKNSDT